MMAIECGSDDGFDIRIVILPCEVLRDDLLNLSLLLSAEILRVPASGRALAIWLAARPPAATAAAVTTAVIVLTFKRPCFTPLLRTRGTTHLPELGFGSRSLDVRMATPSEPCAAIAQMCDHQGFHSGGGRYDPVSHTLRYVVVCDTCHAELREVSAEDYAPRFDP